MSFSKRENDFLFCLLFGFALPFWVELLGAGEDHCEGEGLALAAGEGACPLVGFRLEAVEKVQHFGSGRVENQLRQVHAYEHQILGDRLTWKDVVGLPKVADAGEMTDVQ